ncbi:hypothetical protein D3C75_1143640 [compost metagenome]
MDTIIQNLATRTSALGFETTVAKQETVLSMTWTITVAEYSFSLFAKEIIKAVEEDNTDLAQYVVDSYLDELKDAVKQDL